MPVGFPHVLLRLSIETLQQSAPAFALCAVAGGTIKCAQAEQRQSVWFLQWRLCRQAILHDR